MTILYKPTATNYEHRHPLETPNFLFALREDLRDDKRFLPTRATETDTGYDVRAAQFDRLPIVLRPFQKVMIPLGVRAFCPSGWWYKLVPRSSTFGKKSLHALYGTIDEAFGNEIVFAAQYIPELGLKTEGYIPDQEPSSNDFEEVSFLAYETTFVAPNLTINFGDALGQLIPVRRQEMNVEEASNEKLDELLKQRNAKRTGGFGSSDGK